MSRNIAFENNVLYIGNVEHTLPEKIDRVEQDCENVYVLLDIPTRKDLTYDDYHNVYCFSITGEKRWQIGIRPRGDESVYTMIGFDNTWVYANDFLGRRYFVDKKTGSVMKMIVTK